MEILTAIIAALKEIIGLRKDAREDKKTGIETKILEKELAEKERLIQPATFEDVKRYDPKYKLIATRLILGICIGLAITVSAMVTQSFVKSRVAAKLNEANTQIAQLNRDNNAIRIALESQTQAVARLSAQLNETNLTLAAKNARLDQSEQQMNNLLVRIRELETQNKMLPSEAFDELVKEISQLPKQNLITFLASSGQIIPPFIVTNYSIYQPVDTSLEEGGELHYKFSIEDTGTNYYFIAIWVKATDARTNSVYVDVDDETTSAGKIWEIPMTKGFELKPVRWRDGKSPLAQTTHAQTNFRLGPGEHELIIRGISGNVYFNLVIIQKPPNPVMSLHINSIS